MDASIRRSKLHRTIAGLLAVIMVAGVLAIPKPAPAATIPTGQGNPFTNGDLMLSSISGTGGTGMTYTLVSGVHSVKIGGDTTTQADGTPGPWDNGQQVISGNAPQVAGKNIRTFASLMSGMTSNSWGMSDFANLGVYQQDGTTLWGSLYPERTPSGIDLSSWDLQNATLHCIQPADATPAPQQMAALMGLMSMDYDPATGTYTGTFALVTRNDTSAQAVAAKELYQIRWIDVGKLQITKSSANKAISDGNDCYSLAGAIYGIYKDPAATQLVQQLTTDATGKTPVSQGLVPGSYYVKEIKASKGYALDPTIYPFSSVAGQTTQKAVTDKPQNDLVTMLLGKIDAETTKNLPLGSASLEGAEFNVNYYDGYYTSSTLPATPTRSWIMRTDSEGRSELSPGYLVSGDALYASTAGIPAIPLGTVSVQEIKAPTGYLLGAQPVYVSQISSAGTAETVSTYNAPAVPEQVKRGDLELIKAAETSFTRLAGVPFMITSKTTGESHTIVTDANGHASTASDWTLHTQNTNAGLSAEDGVWFGVDRDGTLAPINDSLGALPYDTYTIKELPCAANRNMTLIGAFSITISRDRYLLDLGTLTDEEPALPEIHTIALGKESGTHDVSAGTTQTVVDTISYKNLRPNEEYTVTASLMNKSAETTVATAAHKFTPVAANGTVAVELSFDARKYANEQLVVFEDISSGDVSAVWEENLENADQTVKVVSPAPKPRLAPRAPKKAAAKIPSTGDARFSGAYYAALLTLALLAALGYGGLRRRDRSSGQER
ncbi:MAG: SpaA isopeptide-forming pilin-related protein [Actinomycetia bacterium]|nr:SpaA isopeptide-forming pilin-related protein [Actinomycetes bacterium]